MNKYLLICIILCSLVSCNDEVANNLGTKPSALGRLNEIEIITDDETWEGPIGDTINYYFGSAYPIMPTPEPMFDMRHFTPTDLLTEPLRKELRTYVVVADLQDEQSPTTKMIRKDLGEKRFLDLRQSKDYSSTIGREKWARNQILVYIMGNGPANLAKSIRENFPAIAQKINDHDEEQLMASIYAVKRTNLGIESRIKDMYGVHMSIPGDFKIAVENQDEKTLWLRRDDTKGPILNIMMRSEPYDSESQFNVSKIKNELNTLSQKYVSSNTVGSKMIINDEDLPVYDYAYNIDSQYTKELRGVWEMTEDFMAGPFVAYTINLTESNTLLYVYAFVYGPGEAKRNLIQQLDYITKTMRVSKAS